MAHLFVDIRGPEQQRARVGVVEPRPMLEQPTWAVAMLAGSIYSLRGSAHETLRPDRLEPEPDRVDASSERPKASAPVLMQSVDADGVEHWIVVDEPGSRLRINGLPLMTGARVDLSDPFGRNAEWQGG